MHHRAPLPFDDFDTSLLLTQFPHTPPLREPQSPYSPRSPTTARGETDDTLGTLEPWRPPNEWECRSPQSAPAWHPAEAVPASPTAVAYGGGGGADHYMSPGLGAVQRELRMMAAASAELTLANLRSEMAGGNEAAAAATGTAVAAVVDAAVYKELEMTKKRWMFSALHRRDGYGAFDCVGLGLDDDGGRSPVVAPLRVLAMYETQGRLSTLLLRSSTTDRPQLTDAPSQHPQPSSRPCTRTCPSRTCRRRRSRPRCSPTCGRSTRRPRRRRPGGRCSRRCRRTTSRPPRRCCCRRWCRRRRCRGCCAPCAAPSCPAARSS